MRQNKKIGSSIVAKDYESCFVYEHMYALRYSSFIVSPINGIDSDVSGIFSAMASMKTV